MSFKRIALASLVASLLLGSSGIAQQSTIEEGKRKARIKVAPVYPELARRMNVVGKVKLELVITPDGRVRSTKVIGGHPLLVQAAQEAVKEWKFVVAPEETRQLVEFDFHEAAN